MTLGRCIADENCPRPVVAKGLCDSHYSNERQKQARIKALEAMGDRHCENCDGLIPVTKDKRARFCSDPCKHKVKWKKKAPVRLRETCEQCGGPMDHKYRDARYCSEECGHKFRNAQKSIERFANKADCANCGKQLPPYRKTFCSDDCKHQSARADTYQLSPEELRELLAANPVCNICRTGRWGKKGPVIDHDHEDGSVRGVLCGHCNMGLGRFHDDCDLMWKAIEYLLKHQSRKKPPDDRKSATG